MDDDHNNDGAAHRTPACDTCKARKIKCDREVPCGSCKAWKITCQTTQRPRERKQRVPISHKYEDQFRDLNRKLENLSVTLQKFVDKASPADSGSQDLHSQVVDVLETVKHEELTDDEDDLFQGDSSFPAQWNNVAEAYSQEIRDHSSIGSLDPNMPNAIGAIVGEPSPETRGSPALPNLATEYPQLAGLVLPPSTLVLNILRLARAHPQKIFHDFVFLDLDNVTAMCQKVYFPTENYSLATYLTVNAVLVHILRDMEPSLVAKINLTNDDKEKYIKLTINNTQTAMAMWNLSTRPDHENIVAILLGATVLMEDCRMFRAWSCISFASKLLHDGGYHRQSSLKGLSDEDKLHRKLLFWTIFSFDRVFALNFGRAPHFQLWDMDIERPTAEEAQTRGPHTLFWIDLAMLHGQIYERLYSPQALAHPDERLVAAQELATTTKDFKKTHSRVFQALPHDEIWIARFAAATEVLLCSVLTIIYRCIPPSASAMQSTPGPLQFCDECIIAARGGLQTLCTALGEIVDSGDESWRIFVHYCVSASPFLPFVVIFGNAMNVPNSFDDYHLLSRVADIINHAATHSRGLAKFNSLCQGMMKVAKAKYEPVGQPTIPDGAQPVVPNGTEYIPIQPLPNLPGDTGVSGEFDPSAFSYMDFSMLDGWELGPGGVESAQEMNTYLGQMPQFGTTTQ